MKKRILSALGAALLLTGVSLVATTGVANAAALTYDINGSWTVSGNERPRITNGNGNIVIDMSYAGRPNATGVVVNSTTIRVTFADAGTLTAQLTSPGFLQWSNGSAWSKVFTGAPAALLVGNWCDSLYCGNFSDDTGYLHIDMSSQGRPTAYGWVVNASTIIITFPDDATYEGSLLSSTYLQWSNGTVWTPEVLF